MWQDCLNSAMIRESWQHNDLGKPELRAPLPLARTTAELVEGDELNDSEEESANKQNALHLCG